MLGNYEISDGSLSIEFKTKPNNNRIYSTTGIENSSSLSDSQVYIYTVIGGTFSFGYTPNSFQDVYVTISGGMVRVEYCDLIFNSPSNGSQRDLKVSAHLLTN